jgi:hypothetical protein
LTAIANRVGLVEQGAQQEHAVLEHIQWLSP